MSPRILIFLFGIPLLLAFQSGSKSAEIEHSTQPKPPTISTDTLGKTSHKPVKEVKPNKTKVHHVKKVESVHS